LLPRSQPYVLLLPLPASPLLLLWPLLHAPPTQALLPNHHHHQLLPAAALTLPLQQPLLQPPHA
jgi:hypothetical protein